MAKAVSPKRTHLFHDLLFFSSIIVVILAVILIDYFLSPGTTYPVRSVLDVNIIKADGADYFVKALNDSGDIDKNEEFYIKFLGINEEKYGIGNKLHIVFFDSDFDETGDFPTITIPYSDAFLYPEKYNDVGGTSPSVRPHILSLSLLR
ncbi:hypothetical protein [Muricomes intestini]|jgi:hypothetical protein|uniref:hypothetical protein n=1 Tax=Muricomes intestini TaxID=1796634 RepID=UPI000E9662BE|nr:hypothetical protein [Lachnospiraceae bacterium]